MNELIETLTLEQLTSQSIPELDLYMDQVIQLFHARYSSQYGGEKVLTKTMINNYAKAKLFPPTKNKKYNKTQIMMMNLIFQLKGTLSLTEIKTLLQPLNEALVNETLSSQDFQTLYDQLMNMTQVQHDQFLAHIMQQTAQNTEFFGHADEYELKLAQILMLTHMSNLSRTMAEQLIKTLGK